VARAVRARHPDWPVVRARPPRRRSARAHRRSSAGSVSWWRTSSAISAIRRRSSAREPHRRTVAGIPLVVWAVRGGSVLNKRARRSGAESLTRSHERQRNDGRDDDWLPPASPRRFRVGAMKGTGPDPENPRLVARNISWANLRIAVAATGTALPVMPPSATRGISVAPRSVPSAWAPAKPSITTRPRSLEKAIPVAFRIRYWWKSVAPQDHACGTGDRDEP